MDSSEILGLLSFLLIGVVVITAVVLWMNREKTGPSRARSDTKTGAGISVLKKFALRNEFRVLGPMLLEHGGRTVRLDGALVGWFGVMGLQSLGYNGEVYGKAEDSQWLWSSADRRENFPNPINECSLAARVMREALLKAGVRDPAVEAVYVFTDPKVNLCIPRNVAPMKLDDLRKLLRTEKYHKDRGYDLDQLCGILQPFVDAAK